MITPFKGFSYKFNAAHTSRFTETGEYRTSLYPSGGAAGSVSNAKRFEYLIDNQIDYIVPIENKKHSLKLTAVQSWEKELSRSLKGESNQFPSDEFGWNMLADGEMVNIGRGVSHSAFVSFVGRATYAYDNKYLAEFTVRYDGSSRFGANNRWGTFPSGSIGWRISEEPFMKNIPQISNLKLRASYGLAGSIAGLSNDAHNPVAVSYGMEFGDAFIMGYLPGNYITNRDIKWETCAELNIGLEFGLFNNRINGIVEFYDQNTYDLLLERQISTFTGYTKMWGNIGQTRGTGLEITLNGDIFRTKDFQWSVGTMLTFQKERIVALHSGLERDVANGWFVGQPISVYYDYRVDGIYKESDFLGLINGKWVLPDTVDTDGDGVPDSPLQRDDVLAPGKIKIHDRNGDGVINAEDRYVMRRTPSFTYNINTTISYKNFDFYMDWYGISGVTRNNSLLYSNGGDLQGKLNGMKVNYYTPENENADFPRPKWNENTTYMSSLGKQNGAYFRLRTVSIGYTIPESLTRKVNIKNIRIGLTATNLLTFTEFLSYSPEYDGAKYPEGQQFVGSLSFTF